MAGCAAQEGDNCPICGGEGVVTRAGRELAEAALCSHIAACGTCGGSGFAKGRDEGGYEVVRPCAAEGLRRRVGLFNGAGVPAAYHGSKLDTYQARGGNQSEIVFQFLHLYERLQVSVLPGGKLAPRTRGIGLSGPPGVGKTHLLTAMARDLVVNLGVAVKFSDFSSLLWNLKAGFDAGRGTGELLQPLIDAEVLFIDEMGKGRATEWELTVVDSLVSERYNRSLTTFFATNYPFRAGDAASFNAAGGRGRAEPRLEALADRVGDRVYSRLQEMCQLLVLTGPDSRAVAPVPVAPGPR